MKIRVTFDVPPNAGPQAAAALINGTLVEADGYVIHPQLGTLTIVKTVNHNDGTPISREDIVVYAHGVWRSVMDVEAFQKSLIRSGEAPSEDSRRRQEAGQARTA